VPTLSVLWAIAHADDTTLAGDERLQYLPEDVREDWANARVRRRSPESFALARRFFTRYLDVVGAMHKAGVQILAGTDTPNTFVYPGGSLHDELQFFVQAGLTPLEALKAATSGPAQFLGHPDLGLVRSGMRADLVILNADPSLDIAHTREIHAVVVRGQYLPRRALDEMLAKARHHAAR
jgi:imidazolonepropionase-like amidohydrolase